MQPRLFEVVVVARRSRYVAHECGEVFNSTVHLTE